MKRLLLIDAVEYPPEKAAHPLSRVDQWFNRHFQRSEEVVFHARPASDPELAAHAHRADAIVISGSPKDAWSDEPVVLKLLELVRTAAGWGRPMLGVCFGHQLLGRAFGGEVRRNPAGWEVGDREVVFTEAGANSPIFAGLSSPLRVMESHQDAVLSLPPGATLLASNAHTPIQAFSIADRIFSVQFHPEMDAELLRHLWSARRERARDHVRFDLDAALDSARDTPEAVRVFDNFLALLNP